MIKFAGERQHTMFNLKGIPLSSGLSRGTAYVYSDILESKHAAFNIRKDQYDSEYSRIHNAKEDVREQLINSARQVRHSLNKNIADIFLSQETMLTDPQLVVDLKQTLKHKHINAEQVVGIVFKRWIRKFQDSQSTMLNERADDIEDLYRRLLGVLVGVKAHRLDHLPKNTILIARRLLPSDTVFLSRQSCSGLLLEIAGPTAHSTILARELGVPCVGRIDNLITSIETGNEILVNGNSGKVIVNPEEPDIKRFNSAKKRSIKKSEQVIIKCFNPAITVDGKTIKVMANVGSPDDVVQAMKSGAEGIGLFRTEGFFLAAKTLPTVAELTRYFIHCLEPIGDKTVNLRLLDIGGDKNIPFLSLPFELNPFLGRRGIRLLFDFPSLLSIQLEAMLNVSKKYNIRVLIPMVTFSEEINQFQKIFEKIAKKKRIMLPPIGAMIETPAAALSIKTMCKQVDFFCIGTNDLTQYVMAADRESTLINEYFKDDHIIILELLQSIVTHAGKTPITLCGELAVKREALGKVLNTGITALSIAPLSIPAIKEEIRHLQIS